MNHTEWNAVPVVASGNGSTTLSVSTQITVSGAARSGWQLAIDPITIKTANSVTVTVKQTEKLTDHAVYSRGSEGNAFGLTVSMEDGSLAFTTDGSPYYVLGEKVSGETSSPSEPGNSLQTGDNSHVALWIVLLAVSVFGLAGTAVYSKRKRVR